MDYSNLIYTYMYIYILSEYIGLYVLFSKYIYMQIYMHIFIASNLLQYIFHTCIYIYTYIHLYIYIHIPPGPECCTSWHEVYQPSTCYVCRYLNIQQHEGFFRVSLGFLWGFIQGDMQGLFLGFHLGVHSGFLQGFNQGFFLVSLRFLQVSCGVHLG